MSKGSKFANFKATGLGEVPASQKLPPAKSPTPEPQASNKPKTKHTSFRASVEHLETFEELADRLRKSKNKRQLFDEALVLLFRKYKQVLSDD